MGGARGGYVVSRGEKKKKMSIITSIQESAEGWKMFFGGVSGVSAPAQKSEIGGALIGPGFSVAQERYAVIKAGGVSAQAPGEAAPVGVKYIPVNPRALTTKDPGTPATVVERIQKSIGESVEGWRIGYAHVAGKAKEGIEKSIAGWKMGISQAGSKVSESFGNIGGGLSSFKYPLYALVAVFLFIAVMVAIGYSGVGGPAARVAEQEYVKRR
jgi:hypothetical protein